ncbi:Free methionine-(R)-sulfoxide reductase [Vibrio sp. qd031]|uniref:GAF domain-containing protein n=1 Tax=Vibrio sp. qd031 TaxID=1603038 RepID=UPI000A11AB59|nr:GAF domain-containing protein [Vibrio sp. qd031]ORT49782.1 Free methionine-(R)-sulfoxide reductase [Vibrio sp. qd031]
MERPDYNSITAQAVALTEGETNLIANLSNLSAILDMALADINWVGFYLFEESSKQLVLGPFQGKPACVRIEPGKGVCGTAFATQSIQRIEDVHQFEGHIACDAASNSEIVLPLWVNGVCIGVLDIDSPNYNRFTADDEQGLHHFITRVGETLSNI